jgi:hypothetical protein
MIDDEGEGRAARRARPIGGEQGKTETVRAARNPDAEPWRRAEGAEWPEQGGELCAGERARERAGERAR